MKKMKMLCAAVLFFTLSYAENSALKLSYENFNFDNSLKKEKGKRYGIALGHQTEMQYTFKKQFGGAMVSATVLGKYMHLQDKNSNNFSKNADKNYFTPGIKIHTHHHGYHVGAGALFGKRIFAVMNDGFKVQHHAMELIKPIWPGVESILAIWILM